MTTTAGPRPQAVAPSPAVAPPPGNPRFPLFDSLRGLAVLAVVVSHVFIFTTALNRRGIGDAVGVAGTMGPLLFFAISGFLLYRPWVAARADGRPLPHTAHYARRRVLRILPAYWFALTVLAVFPGVTGAFTGDWWRYYFFLQLYDSDTLARGIPIAWTLCVEVTFYLALPLWAIALRRLQLGSGPRAWVRAELAALAGLAAFGVAVKIAAGRHTLDGMAAQSVLGQSVWFALGMTLAVVSVAEAGAASRWRTRLQAVAAHPGLCWAGAAAAFAALVVLRAQPDGFFGILMAAQIVQPYPKLLADIALSTLTLGLMLAPAVWDAPRALPQRVLAAAPLAWLGLISYGVYLWHVTIAGLLIRGESPHDYAARGLDLNNKIPNGATPVLLVMTLAASCAIAAFSYRFVELPFLRRKEG
jgi:peptidoglycan/LPS O-acetylase OafA/YrhL